MNPTPTRETLTIVLAGRFNPAIVHPAWLEKEGLVSSVAAQEAKLEVVSPDLSSFDIASKKIQVLLDRMVVSTSDGREDETTRDLVLGILGLLAQTPVTALGLNYEGRFQLSSEDAWHQKGHTWAPKEPWRGVLEGPGLASLTMRQLKENGYRDVKVGPILEPGARGGLTVFSNDHYEVRPPDAGTARSIVEANWRQSLAESRKIAMYLAHEGHS